MFFLRYFENVLFSFLSLSQGSLKQQLFKRKAISFWQTIWCSLSQPKRKREKGKKKQKKQLRWLTALPIWTHVVRLLCFSGFRQVLHTFQSVKRKVYRVVKMFLFDSFLIILKFYYNLKQRFSILLYFKMYFIWVMTKAQFSEAISSIFSLTLFLKNHSNKLICGKQCNLIFLWKWW